MDADARRKPASHPLPPPQAPALFAVRARSVRAADLGAGAAAAFSGPPDTPPRSSLVAVPFFWEEAPGMPKASSTAGAGPEDETGGDRQDSSSGGHGHADRAPRPVPLKLPPRLQQVPVPASSFAAAEDTRHADQARPLPLKLPPRLQQVPVPVPVPASSFAAAEDTPLSSPSPSNVLRGPYYARARARGRRTPRWVQSGGAALRRTPSVGVAFLSRTWSRRRAAAGSKTRGGDHERDAAAHDAPWSWGSPESPSSSSSSASTCFGGDDHGRWRPANVREVSSEEDDASPRVSVRVTRFRLRRNRSVPSMTTTSNLWAAADWIAGALRVLAKPQLRGPKADEAFIAEVARLAEATRQRSLALDHHEADHAMLWVQATAVLNVKALIPVTLDLAANNFSKWRGVFLVVLGKYALTRHVLFDEALSDRPVWVQMDCTVLTWIYSTISNDLLQSLMIHSFNARGAWRFLEDEFLNHSESRALLIETQFHNLHQGSMSIEDYCRRLETMAAALGEFGNPISDRQMVLTLLRGLNDKFRHMVSNLKMHRPFPTFVEARTLLQLEEIGLEAAPLSPPMAMVAAHLPRSTGLVSPTPSCSISSSNPCVPRHKYNNIHRRGRRGKSSTPGGSSSLTLGAAATPHPSSAQPMHMRSYDRTPMVNPCPPSTMATAPLGTFRFPSHGHPSPYYGGVSSAPPLQQFTPNSLPPQQQIMSLPLHREQSQNPMQGGSWDHPSLAHSFNMMMLEPPSAPFEWNTNSGTVSQMTSDAGKHLQECQADYSMELEVRQQRGTDTTQNNWERQIATCSAPWRSGSVQLQAQQAM